MTTSDPAIISPSNGAAAVPDVNVAAGIERLMGNRTIYLRALARFRGDYRAAGTAIREALTNADLPLARRLAHTLKGAAGMIEAGPLHGAAMALEEALRLKTPMPGTPAFDALLAYLDTALARLLSTLDDLLAQEERAAPPPDTGADVVGRLRALLDSGDGAAIDLVDAAGGALRRELGERTGADVSAAVSAFDYERALALLGQSRHAGI